VEHTAGNFPVWLAPVQASVLPISDKYVEYAREVYDELRAAGIRVTIDVGEEKIGAKIRNAELQKIPYMLIVGEKEAASAAVGVRRHGKGDLGAMARSEFLAKAQKEISNRATDV
jgi:threonyl-tRNA synthetase